MSKKAFIWDLDGTLLDSYGVMVDALVEICAGLHYDAARETIHEFIIRTSVTDFIEKMSSEIGIPYADIRARYSDITGRNKDAIQMIPHTVETLELLKKQGAEHYVFTHRGKTTEAVLKRLKIYDYFAQIVTGIDGFPRKPEPDALIYLIEKHNLDKDTTYYVGDRTIDMDCAKNAGVQGILFQPKLSYCQANGSESYVVSDLRDIAEI